MRALLVFLTTAAGLGAATFGWLVYSYSSATPRDLETVDRVEVLKSERTLSLYSKGDLLATYTIALGGDPIGHKLREGDSRTPEGIYKLDWRNSKSKYYRSIHISYPNERDRERALSAGVSPGGDIMIHGQPNGYGFLSPLLQLRDWTDGCIAVTDNQMEEIWRAVPNGTEIEIKP